ncbi:MAG: EAL domain-containing protein [Burkholderiaceae bacterium]
MIDSSYSYCRAIAPCVVSFLMTLAMAFGCLELLSASRVYMQDEYTWSKSRQLAVAQLLRYEQTDSPHEYWAYQSALYPLLDSRGRQLAPERVRSLIDWLNKHWPSDVSRQAARIWSERDTLLDNLESAGQRMHTEISGGASRSSVVLSVALAEVEIIDARMAALDDEFILLLQHWSQIVTHWVVGGLAAGGGLFLLLGLVGSMRTIRRSSAAAREYQRAEARASAEQKRATVTLQSIGDGVITTDRDGRILYLNPAAEQLTGWSNAEALGQPIDLVARFADADGLTSVSHALTRMLDAGCPMEVATEAVLVNRNGSRVPIDELAAPIRDGEDRLIGSVLVLRDATAERALTERLRYQASHDALTGLPNRTEFERCLAQALARRAPGRWQAALYLDLDQLKVVNDTCGHPAGDELIRQVGALVNGMARPGEILARLGGDEFAMLIEGRSPDALVRTAESIRTRLAGMRFAWRGRIFAVSASIGLVVLDERLIDVIDTMSAADSACYLAKENGRNRVHVHRHDDLQMQARSREMQWVARITQALADDRFELYAQEIRPLAPDDPVIHYEILLRLLDEHGESVGPGAFIPAAERFGLMARIDRWVIDHAFRTLAEARHRGRPVPRCMINLSATSLTDAGLVDFISERFAATGLPYCAIGFELTETAAIANMNAALTVMRELKELGCAFALDDFGSGMSSFGYLRNMPIDYLKIDGSFVKNLANDRVDSAMVQSIHQVCRVMGIRSIAEWVEDQATLVELTRIGVDYAQGFGVHKPAPLDIIVAGGSGTMEPDDRGRDAAAASAMTPVATPITMPVATPTTKPVTAPAATPDTDPVAAAR